jgi:hypothetical protein
MDVFSHHYFAVGKVTVILSRWSTTSWIGGFGWYRVSLAAWISSG